MKKLIEEFIDELVSEIKEDYNPGYEYLKRNNEIASCNFVARTTGVVSGTKVSQMVYKRINSKLQFTILKADGEYVNRGDVICVISGPMADILKGEKLALNFVRYMSGIASAVNKYKLELHGLDAELIYSGHAAPGLDVFAEKAFIDGGGILKEEGKSNFLLTRNIATRFSSYQEALTTIRKMSTSFKPIIEVSDNFEFEEAYMTNAPIIRVISNKESIINNCALINQNKKILELVSEIELKKIRSIVKMGYKFIMIPSLCESAKSLPIDLCFYKRVHLNK